MKFPIAMLYEDILLSKRLYDKNNNYAFLDLDDEQITMVKMILSRVRVTKIVPSSRDRSNEVDKSLNLVYDCIVDSIDDLLDWRQLRLKYKGTHITVNILNLQEIKDIEKLKRLNDTIYRCRGEEKICFNLFTKDYYLKEYFTSDGKNLDYRDNLERWYLESLKLDDEVTKIIK